MLNSMYNMQFRAKSLLGLPICKICKTIGKI
jgi:hypothetical protein